MINVHTNENNSNSTHANEGGPKRVVFGPMGVPVDLRSADEQAAERVVLRRDSVSYNDEIKASLGALLCEAVGAHGGPMGLAEASLRSASAQLCVLGDALEHPEPLTHEIIARFIHDLETRMRAAAELVSRYREIEQAMGADRGA